MTEIRPTQAEPPVQHLPVPDTHLPPAARFTIVFPDVEKLSLKAEADARERKQSEAIIEDALRYTPTLVRKFDNELSEITQFLLINEAQPTTNRQKVDHRVADELKPRRASYFKHPRTDETTREITREILQKVHPDMQDAQTRDAIPEELVSQWIRDARELQKNPDYNGAKRLLLASMPRYYTRLVMSMFASGMTVDQIVEAKPEMVGSLERLRYAGFIARYNWDESHIRPQDAERKAASMKREAEINARAVCGGTLFVTLARIVDFCEQANLKTEASDFGILRDNAKLAAGKMGGAAEYRKRQYLGIIEPLGARLTGTMIDEHLLKLPQLIGVSLAAATNSDAAPGQFPAAIQALRGEILGLHRAAESYNQALLEDDIYYQKKRELRHENPHEIIKTNLNFNFKEKKNNNW